jgi:hypothetical protein
MGKQVLLDVRLFAGGVDLSGNSNKVEIDDSMEVKNVTNFRSGGARQVAAGLEEVGISAEGQWEASDPTAGAHQQDDQFWAARRVVEPVSSAASGDSDLSAGGAMYLTQAVRSKYSLLGDIGEVIPWSGEWAGSWPLVRGLCAHPTGVPRTATGTGTAYNLGAVPDGKSLYATLHVLSVVGTGTPTITVAIESDDAIGFATPTTRGTFAAATLKGGEAIRVVGPLTDTWWRTKWTVSGTAPSFLFLVAFGIA